MESMGWKCLKCGSFEWVKRPEDKRTKGIPEELDLECKKCGAVFCAKNRTMAVVK